MDRLPRILYILDVANMYGSEIHLLGLVDYFHRNKLAEIEVLLFSNGPLVERLANLGVRVKIIEVGWLPHASRFFKVLRYVRSLQLDLVHSHQPKALLVGSVIARMLNIPSVITIHSLPEANALQYTFPKRQLVHLFHWVFSFLAQWFSSSIICVSKYIYSRCVFKAKAVVVYNWIGSGAGKCRKPVGLKPCSVDLELVRLLSVGSISYGKGHDLLLDWIFRLRQRYPNVLLDIVGGCSNQDFCNKLKQRAASYGISDIVRWRGYAEDVSAYYNNVDFFVLFSRSEAFGMVYAEALSFGLPVIALDLPTVREVVGGAGVWGKDLETVAERVVALVQNKAKYMLMSEEAKSRSALFDAERNILGVWDVYLELLRSRGESVD